MIMKTCKTHEVKINIAGDLATIENACRKFCLTGLCVTVTSTNYIYTGGAEIGVCVGLINYARFPAAPETINVKAFELAKYLMTECCQRTCSVITPTETHYLENPAITIPK